MKEEQKKFHVLTKDEIIEQLKNMNVDGEKILPFHWFSFIVINPEYEPESFSQEIEDSEEEIKSWDLMIEEMNKPDFDFVWHNTLSNIPRNSEKWLKNHSKICAVKFSPVRFMEQCVNWADGTRNYYSERILNKILEIENIVKFI